MKDFIETSREDYFEIVKDDLANFIVLEADRCAHNVDILVYTPYREDEPVITTYGCFLNKIKPKWARRMNNFLNNILKMKKKWRFSLNKS